MYTLFSNQSRKVLQRANSAALRGDTEYINTEHILLGLIEEGGTGLQVLQQLGVDLLQLETQVRQRIADGAAATGKLPMAPRAKVVIEYALVQAQELKHSPVGTEHILLGLIHDEQGVAGSVLREFVTLEQVRTALENLTQRER